MICCSKRNVTINYSAHQWASSVMPHYCAHDRSSINVTHLSRVCGIWQLTVLEINSNMSPRWHVISHRFLYANFPLPALLLLVVIFCYRKLKAIRKGHDCVFERLISQRADAVTDSEGSNHPLIHHLLWTVSNTPCWPTLMQSVRFKVSKSTFFFLPSICPLPLFLQIKQHAWKYWSDVYETSVIPHAK